MYIGIFASDRRNVAASALLSDSDSIRQVLDPYSSADVSGDYQTQGVRIYQTLTHNTPESLREQVPLVCHQSGLVMMSWLRLDNRVELADKLELEVTDLETVTDPSLVLAAYQKWGDECVRYLAGDFSFVIYNPALHSIFAARDAVGVKPLFYYHDNEQLVICSGARMLHALKGLNLQTDQEWMALYALGLSASYTGTPWPQVKKLAPGHTLSFRNSQITLHRYFELFDDAPTVFERSEQYLDDYKAALDEANLCRLRSHFPIGSETSGGLDSSTVTGYAAMHRDRSKNDFHTFGFAFCENEPEFILETSRLHGVQHNHILTGTGSSQQLRESQHRSLVLLGIPTEHPNATSHDPFYRLCERFGIRTLLSGFGGDEVVTNYGNLVPFELLDNKQYVTLYRNLPGSKWLRPLRFAKIIQRSKMRQAGVSKLTEAYEKRWPLFSIVTPLSEKLELKERFISAASYDSNYRSINQFILGNRWSPAVPTRLDNCTLVAAARKVEYRWPLLDPRLLQQYLSTPSIEKYGAGYGRYLHRRAMKGVAPDKVSWKLSKEMGASVPMQSNGDGARNGKAMVQRYDELLSSLHPALIEIVDTKKLDSQKQMMESINRAEHAAVWFALNMQYTRLNLLNNWLGMYHA